MFVHEYLQYILNALRAHKNVKSFLYTNIYIGDLKIYNKKKTNLIFVQLFNVYCITYKTYNVKKLFKEFESLILPSIIKDPSRK